MGKKHRGFIRVHICAQPYHHIFSISFEKHHPCPIATFSYIGNQCPMMRTCKRKRGTMHLCPYSVTHMGHWPYFKAHRKQVLFVGLRLIRGNFQYPMQTTSSFIYDELLGINPLSPYYDLSRPVFLLGVSRRRQSLDSFQFPKQNTLVGFAIYLFLFRRVLARKYKWHLQSIVGTLKVTTIEGGEEVPFSLRVISVTFYTTAAAPCFT